jgi:ribonuclease HI
VSQRNKPKFYVVWDGRKTGVFDSWTETERQVAGYPQAKYKSFPSRLEAEAAFRGRYWDYAGKNPKAAKKPLDALVRQGVRMDAVAVDAACAGVPGPMEYRGVRVADGEELFHLGPFIDGTNNIGEFLAIVEALQFLKERGQPDLPIYSDSYNARKWVHDRVCKTNLQQTASNAPIFDLISQALRWLRENEVTNPILTWETESWGENPADFGRK